MTAAGAIKGNINANVEAKRIARTQKLMANEGSYVLGYIANLQIKSEFPKGMSRTYLGSFVGELWHAFQHEPLPRAERVAKRDTRG
jgi:hypothetical protein